MLEIRTATVDDVLAIVDLWDRAGGPTRVAARPAEARALIAHDPGALLLADRSGAPVGTLIVGWDGWRCHLYRLAVDPAARRLGVARALVTAGQERAARLGAARLDAMVDPANTSAVMFWQELGFERDVDRRWSLVP
jgi:ribosomal protein S18 acetylase RimI-like enzyme